MQPTTPTDPRAAPARLRHVLAPAALLAVALSAAYAIAGAGGPLRATEAPVLAPAPTLDPASSAPLETAVFAGGCFWGVQAVFQHVEGVTQAVSGYAGGSAATARYALVGTGTTGHAEAVRITYDPRRVSYARLLQVFVSVAHDPTQLDRQGPDSGRQYRSAVFPQSPDQARIATAYLAQLGTAKTFAAPVVTTVEPGATFHAAEAYHQDYLQRHPTQPYIVVNDRPKVEALQRLFPALYRAEPVKTDLALAGAR